MKINYYFFCILSIGISTLFSDRLISYDNQPMGSKNDPFIFRTYIPELEIDQEVLTHHYRGYESPRYSPSKGKDVPGKAYKMMNGLPSAIAINSGEGFSYVWDTLECRLIYLWKEGFLDMRPYWGDKNLGGRKSFGYVPKLFGKIFYQAKEKHPLVVDGKSISDYEDLVFKGYRLEKGRPIFFFDVNGSRIETQILEDEKENSAKISYSVIKGTGKINFSKRDGFEIIQSSPSVIRLSYASVVIKTIPLEAEKKSSSVSIKLGKSLYTSKACYTCHTTDGSKGHGPTFHQIYNIERELVDGTKVKVDDHYLKESIKEPNKKLVKNYPPNFMPPFGSILKDNEIDSLVLYIKSLGKVD